MDPPYRELFKIARFNSYIDSFTDDDQIKVSDVFKVYGSQGALLMLSNSDPKNINPNDNFFDDFYKNFKIHRVQASRNINAVSSNKGKKTQSQSY